MLEKCSTTTEVIDALGGTRAVAELTGRTYNAAFNWRSSKFPTNTYLVIRAALVERGYTAPPSLWGMAEIEQAAE